MEWLTGCEFKEVWLKGKHELGVDVMDHSWDFLLPNPRNPNDPLALIFLSIPSTLTYGIQICISTQT
jgi:hypothetical protein